MQWAQVPSPDFERLALTEAVGAMNVEVEIMDGEQEGMQEGWHRWAIEGLVRERGEVSDGKLWRVRKLAECVEEGILCLC